MEWAGWLFSLPIMGWLFKEVWTNIAQTKFMKKQTENEHLYFKKRLIFEQKNEVYKELNQKIKKMVGSFNGYQNVKEIMESYYVETFNQYVEDHNFTDEENYISASKTYQTPMYRTEINLNYRNAQTKKLHFEFSNCVSLQNYILTKRENEILFEMNINAVEMMKYINQWRDVWNEDLSYSERKDKILEVFGDEYYNKFLRLEHLMYEFMEEIRKEMFM